MEVKGRRRGMMEMVGRGRGCGREKGHGRGRAQDRIWTSGGDVDRFDDTAELEVEFDKGCGCWVRGDDGDEVEAEIGRAHV